MTKRKNLSDLTGGDRADVRAAKATPPRDAGSLDQWDAWRDTKGSDKGWGSCFESHPALTLPSGAVIHGGSCLRPSVKDADVYIGFDSGMSFTQRHWPWKKGDEVLFRITDMAAPADPAEFRKLLAWTQKRLQEGRKVHCGCIGGHGRTGTFLAALCALEGEADPIGYVRANYCSHAVESRAQVDFLVKEFGAKPLPGYKERGSLKEPPKRGGKALAKDGKPPLLKDFLDEDLGLKPVRPATAPVTRAAHEPGSGFSLWGDCN